MPNCRKQVVEPRGRNQPYLIGLPTSPRVDNPLAPSRRVLSMVVLFLQYLALSLGQRLL